MNLGNSLSMELKKTIVNLTKLHIAIMFLQGLTAITRLQIHITNVKPFISACFSNNIFNLVVNMDIQLLYVDCFYHIYYEDPWIQMSCTNDSLIVMADAYCFHHQKC